VDPTRPSPCHASLALHDNPTSHPPPTAPPIALPPPVGNKLRALGEEVGRLSRLRCLILDHNRSLGPLPVPALLALPHLRMLSVTGSGVRDADRAALREGMWAKGGMLCE
jgi:hypothetical protein